MSAAQHVHYEVVNQVALLTLDRQKALNALSHGMVLELHRLLDRAAGDAGVRAVVLRGAGKAFCAGGDVVALADSVRDGSPLQRDFFADEYRLDLRVHTFPKPVVAWLHGVVMGGGMGLAQGASLRVVAEGLRMAMPETRIGLVPDVGASFFFAKMPAPLAGYLALAGTSLGAADALYAGLADARSDVDDPGALPERLRQVAWQASGDASDLAALRNALAPRQAQQGIAGSRLHAQIEAIHRHFDPALTLKELVDGLAAEPGEWAQATLAALRSHSPSMLALTQEALRRGRRQDLRACLRMEFGMVRYALSSGEFSEGVRAHLVDKDRSPRWKTPAIEDLDPQAAAALIARARELEQGLVLPDRAG